MYQNFACRPCPQGMPTNPGRTTCVCSDRTNIFDMANFRCVALPENSGLNDDYSDFVCNPGYKRNGTRCVNTCPEGAFPDPKGNCSCVGGKYLDGGVCKQPVSCPAQSSWNSSTLECTCDNRSLNLINGSCQRCPSNSMFSTKTEQCICSTGFFNIGGECRTCDPRSRYNGNDCVCGWGYFGNRDKCEQCHASCNTCSGPEANQCLSCSDVSLILQNGFCTRNTPCDPGFFLDETYTQTCQKCSDNCIICDDIFECQQCAVGYQT